MKNLEVLFDNIMVEQIQESSLIARPKEDIVTKGRVIVMGDGYIPQFDRFLPPRVKEGDVVYFQPHTAYKIGDWKYIIKQTDLVAVYRADAFEVNNLELNKQE